MWRILIGSGALVILGLAGFFWWKSMAFVDASIPKPPSATNGSMVYAAQPLARPPAASEQTREGKRFDRYDKDQDQRITREEYLGTRRKAWEKLDTNHDGRLSFDEWAAKISGKFATADADHSGALSRGEFETTKVKRKAPARCACSPTKDGEED